MTDPALVRLAAAARVSTEFVDWRGTTRAVPEDSIRAVLASMGVDPADPDAARQELWAAPWRRTLPHVTVATEGRERWVWAHVPHGDPVALEVRLESGGVRVLEQVDHWVEPRDVDGTTVGEATFLVPGDLPLGYHRLVATSGATRAEALLVVAPQRVGLPASMGGDRGWGVSAQLYSVRSADSWGVGDLADLADLAVWAASAHGADFVLVNPLHAGEPVPPLEPSPYLPSSRRFFDPLYLRVERIPEYALLPAVDRRRIATLRARLEKAIEGRDAIDRDAAWRAKRAALRIVRSAPLSAGRALDYAAFREREGEGLERFARWSALAVRHGSDFRTWPAELRDPGSAAVAADAGEHADEVEFACWLQWVLDEQLALAQSKAVGAGMRVGVVQDLAVGVHPGGADAWALAAVTAPGMVVGAPPDPFTQLGQSWDQPPWRPDRLEEAGYAPLRAVAAAAMRHAGGVRVDHVIGMFRLWWVPEGRPATEGCYVGYDDEATIAVLAVEAHRAGAVLIGEDLGVVEPRVREVLAARGILGTSILWFERDGDGPLPAERWREQCLATVTTHDLPPTAGYLAGDHVRLRHRLGLSTRPLDEELAEDAAERERWLAELRSRGLVPDGADGADDERLVVALHEYLTLTPARLLGVALTDMVGDRRTQNQPGTRDEYPNWRVPLSDPDGDPLPLEAVFTSERAARLARAVGGR